MVEMQGGTIHAESELGAGSNFLVRLPKAWSVLE
jgi:signal transduction histidine kinase